MNAAISFLVAVVSVAFVIGITVYGVGAILGEYSILAWIVLGWCGFMTVMKAVNS